MTAKKRFENYPAGTVVLSNLVSLPIYGLGFWIILNTGLVWAFLYLAYVLLLEFRLMRYHCTKCYYWGKYCSSGRGKISSFLFKKGDSVRFACTVLTWKEMVPDLFVSLIPFLTGLVLLVLRFNYFLLGALLLLLLLTTLGNSFIRGSKSCSYCRQQDLGCPAYRLFYKEPLR